MTTLTSSHDVMRLPESAMEFVRVIGLGATLRIVDCAKPDHRIHRKGSSRVRIPMGPLSDDHPLVRTIGRDNAELLHRHFQGETMQFPARRIRAFTRDITIAREFQQGIPVPVLAASHRVSERTVLRALERVTPGDIQRAGAPPPPPPMVPFRGGPLRVARDTSNKG